MRLAFVVLVSIVLAPITISGQSVPPSPTGSVPRLVYVSGVFKPVDGLPAAAVEAVTLAIYAEPEGGTPLWQETQSVAVDDKGRYALLLGASVSDGIPAAAWSAGAQWLGTRFERAGEVEGARVRLTSVPYALRAADADTLGGRPASAYVLAPTAASGSGTSGSAVSGSSAASVPAAKSAAGTASGSSTPTAQGNAILPGAPNYVAKYTPTGDIGQGLLYDTGSGVGLGTTTPADLFHVKFTDTAGAMTGLAVQNMGNTGAPYSGMLFYDQNGAVAQFQGFNNLTHEYRINNVALNGPNYNGSINFMVGSVSKFLVTAPGNIGIGTTTPNALLDVSNALIPTSNIANIAATSFVGSNTFGSELVGRKARGTAIAPTAVQTGDNLAVLGGKGYGTTGFGVNASGMSVWAAENWTDTAQGTFVNLSTSTVGTNLPQVRMTVNSNGNVGIGTGGPTANLEVSNANSTAPFATVLASSFTNTSPSGTLFVGRHARGTSGAPAAVLGGDVLAAYLGSGHTGTAGFSGTRGGMFVVAAENWTSTAQGSSLNFNTTAVGTTTPGTKMSIDPSGDVGIGTFNPAAPIEVSRTGSDSGFMTTVYTNGNNVNPFFVSRFARGTQNVPTAAQTGDVIGAWIATGYGATGFSNVNGGMGVLAQENWTDTAQGTATGLIATPIGTVTPSVFLAVMPSGNVGIGNWPLPTPVPSAADKLQVFGDVRVGTSGTNGCLKDFSANVLAGTCVSDRRFKKNITPFGSVLNQLAALQPVRYYWRAAEFPEQHFGGGQSYGLIAQDVEAVLPELVVTGADGVKAVNYSKLPLLTIQAVKELKSENDALKERVAELERLFAEMRAAAAPR
jgi:hypothetical protein